MKLPIFLLATLLCQPAMAAGKKNADSPAPAKPNIIFILVDDLGWRDVGFTGSKYYDTPHINRLAGEGLRFSQGYAACAVCSPTRASIMTGKYPARLHITDWIPGEGNPPKGKFKVPDWQQCLPLAEVTLAEALKSAGYATAIIGKWHLGGKGFRPEDQGFDTTIGVNFAGQPGSYFFPYGKPDAPTRVPFDADKDPQASAYLTDRITREAQTFIQHHHATAPDQPFFLYLPHYGVHLPLGGRPDLVEKYQTRTPDGGQGNPQYAAMVESVDQSTGALLATLDQLHIRDNTIIIFTGDNGGLTAHGKVTSNAPLRGGKGMAYEGGTREATILSWPGHIPAGDSATPMMSMDFYPTLLHLAGLKCEHPVDGADLSPLWDKSAPADSPIHTRDALFWHYPHYWMGTLVTPYSAVRLGDWKAIHFYEDDHWELYDLKGDPFEEKDVARDNPQQTQRLRARLESWLKETGAQPPQARN